MKELKYFKQLSEYTSDKDNFEYPTVSYVEENTNVYYMEKPAPPIVTYTTTGASQSIKLVSKKEYLDYCKILDTNEELSITGSGALNYTFTNPGEHKVELKFKDDATILASGFSGCSQLTSIPANLFSNNTAVTSFIYTFAYCTGLTTIPENLFSNNTDVNSFYSTFAGCTGLTGGIPEKLFSNNTEVTDFVSTFENCKGLTNISANLFSNNTKVTSFQSTFSSCSGLTNIPENLFSNNTAVTSFTSTFESCSGLTGSIPDNLFSSNTAVTLFMSTFYGCSGLTSIPENLFKYNTEVTNFNTTFTNCSGLTSIPENLFSNNKAVIDFSATFQNCTGLTGNVPVDSDGTPIYNRSTPGKEGYAVVTNYGWCFGRCTGLTDYSSIPSGWK